MVFMPITADFPLIWRNIQSDKLNTPHNNPAAPERSQVIGEMQRLSASGERERYIALFIDSLPSSAIAVGGSASVMIERLFAVS